MAIRPHIEDSPTRGMIPEAEHVKSAPKPNFFQKLHKLFAKDETSSSAPNGSQWTADLRPAVRRDWSSRRPGVGLPRPATFKRMESEKRHRLEPVEQSVGERRALSATRQRALSVHRPRSKSSPPPAVPSRLSAPAITQSNDANNTPTQSHSLPPAIGEQTTPYGQNHNLEPDYPIFPRSPSRASSDGFDQPPDGDDRAQLDLELDSKWILNLSMHFRDKSDREKFFVTYAQTPNCWRRVTVSCDYRDAEPGSLEIDLKELQYQRDKSVQIYESIRDSLPEIQFYDTVTNLKLETSEGRLHVHVTEDVNEIIPYPPKSSVDHILEDSKCPPREIKESELMFDSHLSGFVYKVKYCGRDYIKKEIPGPDTVDEFLYEVNALHALSGSKSVIQLEAIVLDDSREKVKGLLISFAQRGALVDLLYDLKGDISWDDRMRWARQAIQGLNEIHEEGYVQGDFTLSNIVIDRDNDAKIIDINRRGCPVGWEPPEIAKKIASNQRISMYIGEKSDLYQLGMALWALAMEDDEPERHDPPLSFENCPSEVPGWFREVVRICLEPQPRHRLSAKELLTMFPPLSSSRHRPRLRTKCSSSERIGKLYIEPSAAVEREDIERFGHSPALNCVSNHGSDSAGGRTFIDAPSSSYQFDSGSSYVGVTRGRRPPSNTAHLNDSPRRHQLSSEEEIDLSEMSDFEPQVISISPSFERQFDEIELGGNPYLVSRSSFDPEDLQTLDRYTNERRAITDVDSNRLEPIVSAGTDAEPASKSECCSEIDLEYDIDLELDTPYGSDHVPVRSSINSGSTPRNAPSTRATSILALPLLPPLDLATAELAGFGAHPSLDNYSPHEPPRKPDLQPKVNDNEMQDPGASPNGKPELNLGISAESIKLPAPQASEYFDIPTVQPSVPDAGGEIEKQPQPPPTP